MWWQLVLGVLAGVVLLYVVMLSLLWLGYRRSGETTTLRGALRLLPDLIRLLRRLAADSTLPKSVRVRLVLLVAYLLSPIDLIPDFVPVLGYADDLAIVGIALRSVVRCAGPGALERHWPGTPEGLRVVQQVAGLGHASTPRR